MIRLATLALIAACGRVNFDPIGDGSAPRVCGPAYQEEPGLTSKYRRAVTTLDWFAAEADCEADGGHLIVIDNTAENEFLHDEIQGTAMWIGLTDHVAEGTMVWVTGEPLTFDSFEPGEPNDINGEDCVQMLFQGEWNDVGCREGAIDYFCECDTEAPAATYCDTEEPADCGECGAACNQACTNQSCGGGG